MRKRALTAVLALLAPLAMAAGCARQPAAAADGSPGPTPTPAASAVPTAENEEETEMELCINGQTVTVTWAHNAATAALAEAAANGPLTVTASPYGGFEVVGKLGFTLPAADEQTTTAAGDIMLYNSDSIVVFHGSNSWAYTRLGHIADLDADALRELFGSGDVELVLTTD